MGGHGWPWVARSSGVAESGRLVRRMSHRVDPVWSCSPPHGGLRWLYFRTEVKTVHAAGSCGAGDAPVGTCQATPAAPSSAIKRRRGPPTRAHLRRMSGADGGLSFRLGGGGEGGPVKIETKSN
jgi:hypothetical protein